MVFNVGQFSSFVVPGYHLTFDSTIKELIEEDQQKVIDWVLSVLPKLRKTNILACVRKVEDIVLFLLRCVILHHDGKNVHVEYLANSGEILNFKCDLDEAEISEILVGQPGETLVEDTQRTDALDVAYDDLAPCTPPLLKQLEILDSFNH